MQEDWDPIQRFSYDLRQILDHAPDEFEIHVSKLFFEHPCWLRADINLKAKSQAAKKEFLVGLTLAHSIDAYSKVSWNEQLFEEFRKRLGSIAGYYRDQWQKEISSCYGIFEERLKDIDSIYSHLGSIGDLRPRFVCRHEYKVVPLAVALRGAPDRSNIYVANDKGSDSFYNYLRIHTAPPLFGLRQEGVWFEKRLPNCVEREDVVPWFLATIDRLRKRERPPNIKEWIDRILRFNPDLAPPTLVDNRRWEEKPRVIVVFGPTKKVGYRHLYHLERKDISYIKRQKEVLTLAATERHKFADKSNMEVERLFHLINLDEDASRSVENDIKRGERVHFGLDGKTLGIIVNNGGYIHALNAPLEMVRNLCLAHGENLELISNPREKAKSFRVCSF